jgi:DNA polymerase (family 10)
LRGVSLKEWTSIAVLAVSHYLSPENARKAAAAGIMIAVNTDAHGTGELPIVRYGIDQARRAGLEKTTILNCLPWQKLQRLFAR